MTVECPDIASVELEEFTVACALHELMVGDVAPCGRTACLTIRVHGCYTTVSCKQCWGNLYRATKRRAMMRVPFFRRYQCALCKRRSKKLEELIWAEPL